MNGISRVKYDHLSSDPAVKTERNKFNAGYSREFTKHCTGRFYENTTITAATALSERTEKLIKKQEENLIIQQAKLETEIHKVERVQKKLLRQQQREAHRLLVFSSRAATSIQARWKGYVVRSWYYKHQSSRCICRYWRGFRDRRAYNTRRDKRRHELFLQKQHESSLKISRIIRAKSCRSQRERLMKIRHRATIQLQTKYRQYVAKAIVDKRRQTIALEKSRWQAAIQIQRIFRGFIMRQVFADILHYAITVQSAIRSFLAQRHMERLRMEQHQNFVEGQTQSNDNIVPRSPRMKTSRVRQKIMAAVAQGSLPRERHCPNCSRCSSKVERHQNSKTACNNLVEMSVSSETTARRRQWLREKEKLKRKEIHLQHLKVERESELSEIKLMAREDRAMRVLRKLSQRKKIRTRIKICSEENETAETKLMEREDRAMRVLQKLSQRKRSRQRQKTIPQIQDMPVKDDPAKYEELNPEPGVLLPELTALELKVIEQKRAKIALKKQRELREQKSLLDPSVDFGVFSDINRLKEQPNNKYVERKPAVPRQHRLASLMKRRKKKKQYGEVVLTDDRVELPEFQGADYGNEFEELVNEEEIGLMCHASIPIDLGKFN